MNLYAHRTCVCGKNFTTDCNEYTCSVECEDHAWDMEMEQRNKDMYLDSLDHGEEETS